MTGMGYVDGGTFPFARLGGILPTSCNLGDCPAISCDHYQTRAVQECLDAATSSRQLNLSLVSTWLRDCETNHTGRCDHSLDGTAARDPIPLILLDVENGKLICGNSAYRYVTLSYVWGEAEMFKTVQENFSTRQQDGYFDTHLEMLPAVVQGAVTFVKRLGERYLWVDTLCIVQDDEVQKPSQIAQMDRVYYDSLLTIIAMSGKDAYSRLPGVGPNSRESIWTNALTGCWLLRSKGPGPDTLLGLGQYESRGWTLQERLLSRRRLYLTNYQAYFQCNSSVQSEDRAWTRNLLQDSNRIQTTSLQNIPPGGYGGFNFSKIRLSGEALFHIRELGPWDQRALTFYNRLISVYTRREFTNKSDTLNGFAGFSAVLDRRCGGPVWSGLPGSIMDHALLWNPIGSLCRRTQGNFPSWS